MSPTSTREVAATLAIVCGLLVAVVWSSSRLTAMATDEQCDAVLRQYARHRLHAHTIEPTDDELDAHERVTLERAQASARFDECPHELTEAHVECALAAPSADAFEKCLQ